VLKKQISQEEIMNRALKKAIDQNYQLLLTSKEFDGNEVVEDAVNIDLAKIDRKNLEIIFIFERLPEVTIGNYKTIKLTHSHSNIEDREIENEISRYTKRDTMLIPKESGNIAQGDMVNFDFKGFIDDQPFTGGEAKGHELEIGSGNFIPGFEEQLVGLQKGEKKTIQVTFPKDYHAKDLANKKASFELVNNDIKTIQKPKLDEAYIARFAIDGVKNEEQFKKYIGKQLKDHKEYTNMQDTIHQISE
jgi:trigger factor